MDFPIRFRGEEEIGGVSPCHGGRKSPIATSLHFTEFFFLFLFFFWSPKRLEWPLLGMSDFPDLMSELYSAPSDHGRLS